MIKENFPNLSSHPMLTTKAYGMSKAVERRHQDSVAEWLTMATRFDATKSESLHVLYESYRQYITNQSPFKYTVCSKPVFSLILQMIVPSNKLVFTMVKTGKRFVIGIELAVEKLDDKAHAPTCT